MRAYLHFHPHPHTQAYLPNVPYGEKYFHQPLHTLIAYKVSEVLPILIQAQNYSQQGYWVLGFVAYEAYQAFSDDLPLVDAGISTIPLPLVYFAVYRDHDQIYKNYNNSTYLNQKSYLNHALSQAWQDAHLNKSTYLHNIGAIQEDIRQGCVYQVNYTQTLCMPSMQSLLPTDDAYWLWHQSISRAQPYSYGALLAIPFNKVAGLGGKNPSMYISSHSPELFFSWDGQTIFTQPMKGTRARHQEAWQDQQESLALQNSAKERAENIMIVDLMRNDLSKIAYPHSVKVPQLLECLPLPSVWQMVSGIQASTRDGIGLADIFSALFPCGSITGAPKKAAIDKIHQYEKTPRGVYCGAIGYLTPGGKAFFNVAIRTLVDDGQHLHYGVGSGITIDSDPEQEWAEWQWKTAFLKK